MSGVRAHILAVAGLCLAGAGVGIGCSGAAADTLEWALVQAYQNNPSLNAQRASLRAVDENVPQALSGYRPKVSATAGGGYNYTNAVQQFPLGGVTPTYRSPRHSIHAPSAPQAHTRCSTATRPPIARARRKARSTPPARLCASPSSRSCSMPQPPT